MTKLNESQIKLALTTAKAVSAARDARRESSHFAQTDPSEHSKIHANERAAENLLASFLAKAGFEVDTFEKIRAQNQIELDRVQAQRKDEAIKRSSAVRETLRFQVASRLKTVASLPTEQRVLLDTPFLIWATQGLLFDSSLVEPANSFAKISINRTKADYEDFGYEELSFYFLFQNPSDKFAIFNVDGYLVANGYCEVWSNAGTMIGLRSSNLHIRADLRLWEWWNHPPTEPFPQVDQSQPVADLFCESGGWFASPAGRSKYVYRGYDLQYNRFLIPPKEFAVIEVAVSIKYWFSEGGIDVDFASGDFQVTCPAVLLTILN